jgi:YHS domain-containing protein
VALAILWGNQRRSVTEALDPLLLASDARASNGTTGHAIERALSDRVAHVDPVCNMEVGRQIETRWAQRSWFFCTERCRDAFNEEPQRYAGETCLVCRSEGLFTPVEAAPHVASWQGKEYRFCTPAHRDAFRGDPLDYFLHSMWGLPGWLYYASIAMILLLSFLIFEWRALRGRAAGAAGRAVEATRPRVDLFHLPGVRTLAKSSLLRFLLRATMVALFALVVAAGLFGNQLPSKNIAPLLTWTIWWGGLIWLVAYLGKAWCYVCPWDAIAEWSEGLKLWGQKRAGLGLGLAWPRWMRSIWPATLLFIALTWIELGFGVTLKPRVTAWLGLAILALAFASAFLFRRKSFCRYGCLVGRISGLYSLFAPIELRARDRDICRSCRTHSCYKGNDQGEGCPTFEFPALMQQNTYCILCMECVKTCESENVTLRLRPWGEDLFAHRRPRSDEAYLALIMLSLTGFHGLTMTAVWRDATAWLQSAVGLGETLAFSLGMVAIMVAPVLLYAGLVAASRALAGWQRVGYREYFVRYAYALLPIALFYHLAHNSEHLLMEGQKVAALLSDPLGSEMDLIGTAGWSLQPLVNLPTLWLLQVFFVAIGHVFSLWAARRAATTLFPTSKSALRSQLPMLTAMILFSVMSLWLLKQPMEMRTSAM